MAKFFLTMPVSNVYCMEHFTIAIIDPISTVSVPWPRLPRPPPPPASAPYLYLKNKK